MQVKIGVSARHVHLKQEHLEILFGKGYELELYKNLSQPGQYASKEKVSIRSNKLVIDGVRILGPIRPYTQVEISKTDAINMGLNPPVRESGDLEGSSPITIVGPKGEVNLDSGCIIASRHIHLTSEDVKKHGLQNVSKVKVKLAGLKGGIIDNVSLRVSDAYVLEMHIDTDDSNAHLVEQGDLGEVIVGDYNG